MAASNTYAKIYKAVGKIPFGRVATYGDIAKLTQCSGPRQVGYALHASRREDHLPWHRVINSLGKISPRTSNDGDDIQRLLLLAEGLNFGSNGTIDLKKYRWHR